ncbi:MAG: hypothetical protein FWH20_08635 [Oscillospiraceae bacterium]|nr:hypothetical protein [Oscillospiraceae bacterium]
MEINVKDRHNSNYAYKADSHAEKEGETPEISFDLLFKEAVLSPEKAEQQTAVSEKTTVEVLQNTATVALANPVINKVETNEVEMLVGALAEMSESKTTAENIAIPPQPPNYGINYPPYYSQDDLVGFVTWASGENLNLPNIGNELKINDSNAKLLADMLYDYGIINQDERDAINFNQQRIVIRPHRQSYRSNRGYSYVKSLPHTFPTVLQNLKNGLANAGTLTGAGIPPSGLRAVDFAKLIRIIDLLQDIIAGLAPANPADEIKLNELGKPDYTPNPHNGDGWSYDPPDNRVTIDGTREVTIGGINPTLDVEVAAGSTTTITLNSTDFSNLDLSGSDVTLNLIGDNTIRGLTTNSSTILTLSGTPFSPPPTAQLFDLNNPTASSPASPGWSFAGNTLTIENGANIEIRGNDPDIDIVFAPGANATTVYLNNAVAAGLDFSNAEVDLAISGDNNSLPSGFTNSRNGTLTLNGNGRLTF